MKIMFICTGNICRSAMAEAMFKKMISDRNRKDIEVYSCGVFAENGDISTENAVQTMREYGIDLTTHKATNIKNSNIEDMDIILCATSSHKFSVLQLYPELQDKVFTMKEYAGLSNKLGNMDISDPWGYNLQTYQNCAKEIESCLEEIIKKI